MQMNNERKFVYPLSSLTEHPHITLHYSIPVPSEASPCVTLSSPPTLPPTIGMQGVSQVQSGCPSYTTLQSSLSSCRRVPQSQISLSRNRNDCPSGRSQSPGETPDFALPEYVKVLKERERETYPALSIRRSGKIGVRSAWEI